MSKTFDGIEVYAGSDEELYFDFYGNMGEKAPALAVGTSIW